MDAGQIIITLGAMATAGSTLVGLAHVASGRKRCECSRTAEMERDRTRLEAVERDTKRNYDAIQDLYDKHHETTELNHKAQLVLARIETKLEK